MTLLETVYLKNRERFSAAAAGQTMTEYALILGSIAVVVFVTYQILGQDISKAVNRINSTLTAS